MIYEALTYLSTYLGSWGITFFSTMLFIIIIRIGFAFVFKLLRLNIDYHNTAVANKTLIQHMKK